MVEVEGKGRRLIEGGRGKGLREMSSSSSNNTDIVTLENSMG